MTMNYSRTERVENVDGMLCRFMFAQNHEDPLLVAKVSEDGKQVSRNIAYRGLGGWCYYEPGHKVRGYCGSYIAEIDPWSDSTPCLNNFCWSKPSEADKAVILAKYPDFKWVLAKVKWSIADIFKALPLWKKDARLMETLCSMGLTYTALNGSFYSWKDRWDIVKEISRNPEYRNYSLADIRLMRKYNATYNEVEAYRRDNHKWESVTFEEWRYISGTVDAGEYNDYCKMCAEVGHDLKDPYWHFPKNFKKQHDKVMREVKKKRKADEEIRKARIAAERAEHEKSLAGVYAKFSRMMKKYAGKCKEGALEVMVPQNVEDVRTQAEKLHQCLIICDYISKVVAKKCLLVFVLKNGKPYATAELVTRGRKFKIGQFNGNQHAKRYTANEDARKALDLWIKANDIKMVA